jgi:hypothetical protein
VIVAGAWSSACRCCAAAARRLAVETVHALRHASLIAGARLDCLVRTHAQRANRCTMFGLGLVALGISALAYLRGAELHWGLAGSQPGLLSTVTGLTSDDRA